MRRSKSSSRRTARLTLACVLALVGPVVAAGRAADKGTGGNIGNVPLPICLTLVGDSSCNGRASGNSGPGGGNTGGNLANYPIPICITAVGDAKCDGPASGNSGPSGSGNTGGNVGNAPVPVCYTSVGNAECDGAASGNSGTGGKDTGGNVGNYPVPECYSVIGNVHCDGKPSGDAGDPVPGSTPAPTAKSAPPMSASLFIPNQRLRRVLRKGLRTSLYCSSACGVKAWLFVGRYTARKAGLPANQKPVIGRRSGLLTQAGGMHFVVPVTRTARRAFAHARAVRMILLVKVIDPSGQATVHKPYLEMEGGAAG